MECSLESWTEFLTYWIESVVNTCTLSAYVWGCIVELKEGRTEGRKTRRKGGREGGGEGGGREGGGEGEKGEKGEK